jgi:hypothetical protein
MIYKMRERKTREFSFTHSRGRRFKGGDKKAQHFNSAQVLQAIPLFSPFHLLSFEPGKKRDLSEETLTF